MTISDVYKQQQMLLWTLKNKHTLDLQDLNKLTRHVYNISGAKNLHYSKLSTAGYLNQHSVNVAILSGYVARTLDIELEVGKIKKIISGSLLHDTGKLFTSPDILDKPGKLDTLEKNIMQTHPYVGLQAIKEFIKDEIVEEIVSKHHSIPEEVINIADFNVTVSQISAYICYVTDITDAMLSQRCYKEVATPERTIAELRRRNIDNNIINILEPIILPG